MLEAYREKKMRRQDTIEDVDFQRFFKLTAEQSVTVAG